MSFPASARRGTRHTQSNWDMNEMYPHPDAGPHHYLVKVICTRPLLRQAHSQYTGLFADNAHHWRDSARISGHSVCAIWAWATLQSIFVTPAWVPAHFQAAARTINSNIKCSC
ncbi:uncharacterized protein [Dermacentor albipictus]|uniref:uncharacterized protein n=1 Tax=Dermacentor albipictus TaxID=60249 RepID=UPI0038FC5BA4